MTNAVYQNLKFLVERIDPTKNSWKFHEYVRLFSFYVLLFFFAIEDVENFSRSIGSRRVKCARLSKVTSEISHQLSQWRIFEEYSIVTQSAGGSTVN